MILKTDKADKDTKLIKQGMKSIKPEFWPLLIFVIIFVHLCTCSFGQIKQHFSIHGTAIEGAKSGDSIFFGRNYNIEDSYYQVKEMSSVIDGNHFDIQGDISYPHMFTSILASDRGKIVMRAGTFFIDNTSNSLTFNYKHGECGHVNGHTSREYLEDFIPFIMNGKLYDCKDQSIFKKLNDKDLKIDSLLLNYVEKYPDSYVALWHLISRYSRFGHNDIREKAVGLFSGSVKSSPIWRKINHDLKNSWLKTAKTFPSLNLKDSLLNPVEFKIPKAKYIIVDFWFHNCIPCIQAFPELKQLYNDYQKRGLEIISISIDDTYSIPKWKSRMYTEKLPWKQYLDENQVNAKKMFVMSFPRYVLLDSSGKVIHSDIEINDLTTFVKNNL